MGADYFYVDAVVGLFLDYFSQVDAALGLFLDYFLGLFWWARIIFDAD